MKRLSVVLVAVFCVTVFSEVPHIDGAGRPLGSALDVSADPLGALKTAVKNACSIERPQTPSAPPEVRTPPPAAPVAPATPASPASASLLGKIY